MAPKQTDPQFKLRMTPEIKEAIERAAVINNRSMNAEILHRLQITIEADALDEAPGDNAHPDRLHGPIGPDNFAVVNPEILERWLAAMQKSTQVLEEMTEKMREKGKSNE